MISTVFRTSFRSNSLEFVSLTSEAGRKYITTSCFRSTAGKTYSLFGQNHLPIRARRYQQISQNTIQRRRFATNIQASLPDKVFFNRKEEIDGFNQMLQSKPQLSIVTGPVNSGKTALLRKILQEQSELDQPVLHLDLRSRSFNTVNGFVFSLEIEMGSWLDRFAKIAQRVSLSPEVIGLKVFLGDGSPEPSSIERLNGLFAKMDQQLSPYNLWSGEKSPILFIDEASKLRQLLKDDQGRAALINLFDWFIKNTKQDPRFHVILGSSNSFFHLWVAEYVGSSRFVSYVVGDLTRDEAQRFWETKVITQVHLQKDLQPPPFDDAYRVCGGSMFLLEKYYFQFLQMKGRMQFGDFSLIGEERMRVLRAYFKKGDSFLLSHADKVKPIWNKKQLIKVMEKLTNSKSGFLIYDDLCKELGSDVVNAFVDYNLLHLRPSKNFAYDLPGVPPTKAILTAETPASLVAMREVLADIKSGVL